MSPENANALEAMMTNVNIKDRIVAVKIADTNESIVITTAVRDAV